ncbi:hypothetical protein, partial [Salmonella sp. s54836]|uniref:hypothetical protein n=1 Tax=Salmonella sp. s54836 TaxID=3159673 RepID=UPI0039812D93
REQFFRYGEGFILVYSIIDRASFLEVEKIDNHIARVRNKEHLPRVLVANKADLASQRVVSALEGDNLAQKLKLKYVEASAKHNVNVTNCFYEIVRCIRASR